MLPARLLADRHPEPLQELSSDGKGAETPLRLCNSRNFKSADTLLVSAGF